VLIFDVQNRLDAMVTGEQQKSVFETETRIQTSLVSRVLPVDVELRSPPMADAVLELDQVTKETVAAVGAARHRLGVDCPSGDFLHLAAVCDEVRFLVNVLSEAGLREG